MEIPRQEQPKQLDLTAAESAVLQSFNLQAFNAKVEIYDLQVALKVARSKLATAQSGFSGALALAGHTRGLDTVRVSPDFKSLLI
jgi:glutamate formiminotransferase